MDFTTSYEPIIPKVKIVGLAPLPIKYWTISLRPTWDAAPIADSKSPNRHSQTDRASSGLLSTSFFTPSKSECDFPTTSETISGSMCGKCSGTLLNSALP
jgi:hypothetical protein